MDIIDVWLPILIILLSALSPLIKSLNKKMDKWGSKDASLNGDPSDELPTAQQAGRSDRVHVFESQQKRHLATNMEASSSIGAASSIRSATSEMAEGIYNQQEVDTLRKRITDPVELKRALILNEILNRKYT